MTVVKKGAVKLSKALSSEKPLNLRPQKMLHSSNASIQRDGEVNVGYVSGDPKIPTIKVERPGSGPLNIELSACKETL